MSAASMLNLDRAWIRELIYGATVGQAYLLLLSGNALLGHHFSARRRSPPPRASGKPEPTADLIDQDLRLVL